LDFFDTVIFLGDESINLEDIQLLSSPVMLENRLVDCDGMIRVEPIFILVILQGHQVTLNPSPDLLLAAGDQVLAVATS
jgi:hypothetical protein